MKLFKFLRGLKASLPTLSEGQPGYVTDEKRLYIGNADGENTQIANVQDLEAKQDKRANPRRGLCRQDTRHTNRRRRNRHFGRHRHGGGHTLRRDGVCKRLKDNRYHTHKEQQQCHGKRTDGYGGLRVRAAALSTPVS